MKLLSSFPVGALLLGPSVTAWQSFSVRRAQPYTTTKHTQLSAKKPPAGAFFNQVPQEDDCDDKSTPDDMQQEVNNMLQARRQGSIARQPSTINGIPTSKVKGFAKQNDTPSTGQQQLFNPPGKQKPFIGVGPPLNDPTKPEYDDQGYTLYADERTGEKSRVFEALVDYPCKFTMKIVGANEGLFVEEMVAVVAETCKVEIDEVDHSTKTMGKWMSVTVEAPVESAEMLYELYECVDRDPRVKFKF